MGLAKGDDIEGVVLQINVVTDREYINTPQREFFFLQKYDFILYLLYYINT